MKLVAIKEGKKESRISLTPTYAKKLIDLGFEVEIESGLGDHLNIYDEDFSKVGVKINKNRKQLLSEADIILKVNKPNIDELSDFKKDALHISFLDPFFEKDLIKKLLEKNISSISVQLILRTTLAQKMDALSSQANLAGYAAVILAAKHFLKILPMMTTPAGTISPARVFIIGAGVAGLQAIATAKRLGARVEAFDTRAVTKEQVKSLGAKFLEIDMGENKEVKGGYAKELTKEQLEKQKLAMIKSVSQSDIVITTAQVFGRKAPLIVTKKMIKKMKKGSVIIDMAVSTGGNVEGSKENEIVDFEGVKIIAPSNLLDEVAYDASVLYSSNLFSLIESFYNKETKKLDINLENEILKNALVTYQGNIISPILKKGGF